MYGSYWMDENGWPTKGPHGLWAQGELEEAMVACGWRNVSKWPGVQIWETTPRVAELIAQFATKDRDGLGPDLREPVRSSPTNFGR